MNAQILLVFCIGETIQGRLAGNIMEGKPDKLTGELSFRQTDEEQAAEVFGGEFVLGEEETFHEDIPLTDLMNNITESGSYRSLAVPREYVKPGSMFAVRAVFDLTEKGIFLAGKYWIRSGLEAELAICFSKRETGYDWWMGAQLKQFSLSDISSSLEGLEHFLGLQNAAAAVVLSNTQQEVRPGQEISFLSDIEVVRRGLTFQIEVNFADNFLKEILEIQGNCRVSGYIPADAGQEIALSGYGEKIVFLQFIDLTEITIMFHKNATEKTFAFSASGNVQFKLRELQTPKVRVEVLFEEERDKKVLTVQGRTVEPIDNPLGIPNTRLEKLEFHAISEKTVSEGAVKKREEVFFQGKTVIAGMEIAAAVYFAQKQPALVELTVGNQAISISGLVAQYFDFRWPELLDIRLENGCIWYCLQDVVLNGRSYRKGFHAQLDTKMFFLPEFTLALDIGDKTKLTASATVKKAAKLAFVKFYTMQGEQECGPRVAISVSGASTGAINGGSGAAAADGSTGFMVTSRIDFFSTYIGEAAISVRKDTMEGTFRFPPGFAITGNVKFIVNQEGKLSFGGYEAGGLSHINLDLPKMELGAGKCGIKMPKGIHCKAHPSLKNTGLVMGDTEMGVKFDIDIQIKSELSFSEDDSISLIFREMSFTVNKNITQELTFEAFGEILADNIENFVKKAAGQVISGQIFDDVLTEEGMQKLAKFLAIEGMTWGVEQLINYLICKGLPKALAGAFMAALTGVEETLWEGLGFILLLGGLLGFLDADGNYTVKKKANKPNEDDPGKNPQTPAAPTVSFREEKLMIRWPACENTEMYYPVVIRTVSEPEREEQLRLTVGGCEKPFCEIAGSDVESGYLASYGFTYQIKIYAWNQEGASIGEAASIYLLKRPEGLQIRYKCALRQLCLQWELVEGAEEYEVELLPCGQMENQGESGRKSAVYPAGTTKAVYDGQEPERLIEVLVRGNARNVIGPAASLGEIYLYDLKAPKEIEGYVTDDGIVLEWEKVAYADRYRIDCRDERGGQIELPVSTDAGMTISAERLQDNVCYTICIQPMTQEIEGWISKEVQVLWWLLPVPEIREAVCGEDGIMEVTFYSGNAEYRQLVYPDGRAVVLDDRQVSCEWEIGERARVRLVDRARRGKWSRGISVKPVRTPEKLQVSIGKDGLHVCWEEAEANSFYGIEVVAGEVQTTEEMLMGTSWDADMSGMPEDGLVRVCLYAIDPEDTRRRSPAAETSWIRGCHS